MAKKWKDPYMEKVQTAKDPVIRRALERMLRAARDVFGAKSQLEWAMKDMERHRDFQKTERAVNKKGSSIGAMTLAWWVHDCMQSALEDGTVADAGDWLLVDSDPKRAAAGMRKFVESERDFARRKKERAARAVKAKPAKLHVVQAVAV